MAKQNLGQQRWDLLATYTLTLNDLFIVYKDFNYLRFDV